MSKVSNKHINLNDAVETIDKLKSKNILIVSFTASTPHLETSLEITKRLAAKNCISYVHLGKYISRPTLYSKNFLKRKTQFIYRINRARKYIEEYVYTQNNQIWIDIKDLEKKINSKLNNFEYIWKKLKINSNEELKQQTYNQYKIGYGLINNLISDSSNTNPFPLSKKLENELKQNLFSSIKSILFAEELLNQKNKYDTLIILNGRFNCEHSFKQVAIKKGLQIYYHECGAPYPKNRFFFENYMPQNFDERKKEMMKLRSRISTDKIKQDGIHFFTQKLKGEGVYEQSYVKDQNQLLSYNLQEKIINHKKSKRPIISFFTSNDDEFFAIDGNENRYELWGSQISAIKKISIMSEVMEFLFIVRIHPNLKNKSEQEEARWDKEKNKIKSHSCVWIDQNSKESSYKILNESDIVITAGSTVGIEAIYLEKISLTIAKCYYDEVISPIKCISSPKEIEGIISRYDKIKKPTKDESYIYGAWTMNYGSIFKYFNHYGNGIGTMENNYKVASAGRLQKSVSNLKIIYKNILTFLT